MRGWRKRNGSLGLNPSSVRDFGCVSINKTKIKLGLKELVQFYFGSHGSFVNEGLNYLVSTESL
jgi:hypothetical protein